jgi:hypothetical protein
LKIKDVVGLFHKLQSVSLETSSELLLLERLVMLRGECVSLEYLFEGGTRTVTLWHKNTRDAKNVLR